MTTSANGLFVGFLQSEYVYRRQEFAARESVSGVCDQPRDVLRPSAQIQQAEFTTQAAGDEVRPARVTNVV